MGLINSPYNGATEIPGTSNESLFVFLGGPIRYWWTAGKWGTRQHKLYMNSRDYIHAELSDNFLVYAPHRAWRGPWNDVAQHINDHAVLLCDAVVWLRMDGVTAQGTDEELLLATDAGKPNFMIRVGDNYDIRTELSKVKQQLFYLGEQQGRIT